MAGSGPLDDSSLVEEHIQGNTENDQRDEVCLFAMILVLPLLALNAKRFLAIDVKVFVIPRIVVHSVNILVTGPPTCRSCPVM